MQKRTLFKSFMGKVCFGNVHIIRKEIVILELMHSSELYISCFFEQKLFFILCIPSLCYKEKSGCIGQNKGKLLYFSFL